MRVGVGQCFQYLLVVDELVRAGRFWVVQRHAKIIAPPAALFKTSAGSVQGKRIINKQNALGRIRPSSAWLRLQGKIYIYNNFAFAKLAASERSAGADFSLRVFIASITFALRQHSQERAELTERR